MKKGTKNTGQLENKQQDGKCKTNHINTLIKYK